MSDKPQYTLVHKGDLKGHGGWVTAIAAGKDVVISASRDKSLIVWKIERDDISNTYGAPAKRLVGHNHFVQDVALTHGSEGHAVSASWDGTLRLWDLSNGSSKRFVGHSGDVLSVAFAPDNRRIVSASRDKTVKLWNTRGQCKQTFKGHQDWVSAVKVTGATEGKDSVAVSASWDKTVKVWSALDAQRPSVAHDLKEHTGYLNTISLSPDGSLCASGGKDGVVTLWDINEGKALTSHNGGDVINALAFSPVHYWICIAMPSKIIVWDLVAKQVLEEIELKEIQPTGKMSVPIQCVSVAWSQEGNVLYAGYTDNVIRVFEVENL